MAVSLPPNSTGSNVDVLTPTTGYNRQVIVVGDPTTGANYATIENLVSNTYAAGLVVLQPTTWSLVSTPASATQATVTQSAGGAGVIFVAQSISFAVAVDGTHAQTAIQVNLRNGATGAGTILWSQTVVKSATEAITFFHASNLNIVGSANTAMTLEFSAAGAVGSYQSVTLTGYSI